MGVGVYVAMMCIVCITVITQGQNQCYVCDRVTVIDYNGASESDFDDALAAQLGRIGVTNSANCADGSVTDVLSSTCQGSEVCAIIRTELKVEYNSVDVTVEAEHLYCVADSSLDEDDHCVDETADEFEEQANVKIGGLVSSGSELSNIHDYHDGEFCKCQASLCNDDHDDHDHDDDDDHDHDDHDDHDDDHDHDDDDDHDDETSSSFPQTYTGSLLITALLSFKCFM